MRRRFPDRRIPRTPNGDIPCDAPLPQPRLSGASPLDDWRTTYYPNSIDPLTAKHILVKAAEELRDAKLEIENLRVNLAESEARLRAMNDHNDWLSDRLTLATIDRTLAMDQRAEYAVKLDMLRKILNDTGTA